MLLPSGWTGRARLAATFPFQVVQGAWLGVLSPIADWADRIGRLWRSAGEARELRTQNARLRAQLVEESERRHELELRLNQLTQLPAEAKGRPVEARILSYDASALRRTAVLNRGGDVGVRPNAPVLWNGALIGRVDSVDPWQCRVVLVGDRECSLGVRCARTRVQGVLKGVGGGEAQVDDIGAQAEKSESATCSSPPAWTAFPARASRRRMRRGGQRVRRDIPMGGPEAGFRPGAARGCGYPLAGNRRAELTRHEKNVNCFAQRRVVTAVSDVSYDISAHAWRPKKTASLLKSKKSYGIILPAPKRPQDVGGDEDNAQKAI